MKTLHLKFGDHPFGAERANFAFSVWLITESRPRQAADYSVFRHLAARAV